MTRWPRLCTCAVCSLVLLAACGVYLRLSSGPKIELHDVDIDVKHDEVIVNVTGHVDGSLFTKLLDIQQLHCIVPLTCANDTVELNVEGTVRALHAGVLHSVLVLTSDGWHCGFEAALAEVHAVASCEVALAMTVLGITFSASTDFRWPLRSPEHRDDGCAACSAGSEHTSGLDHRTSQIHSRFFGELDYELGMELGLRSGPELQRYHMLRSLERISLYMPESQLTLEMPKTSGRWTVSSSEVIAPNLLRGFAMNLSTNFVGILASPLTTAMIEAVQYGELSWEVRPLRDDVQGQLLSALANHLPQRSLSKGRRMQGVDIEWAHSEHQFAGRGLWHKMWDGLIHFGDCHPIDTTTETTTTTTTSDGRPDVTIGLENGSDGTDGSGDITEETITTTETLTDSSDVPSESSSTSSSSQYSCHKHPVLGTVLSIKDIIERAGRRGSFQEIRFREEGSSIARNFASYLLDKAAAGIFHLPSCPWGSNCTGESQGNYTYFEWEASPWTKETSIATGFTTVELHAGRNVSNPDLTIRASMPDKMLDAVNHGTWRVLLDFDVVGTVDFSQSLVDWLQVDGELLYDGDLGGARFEFSVQNLYDAHELAGAALLRARTVSGHMEDVLSVSVSATTQYSVCEHISEFAFLNCFNEAIGSLRLSMRKTTSLISSFSSNLDYVPFLVHAKGFLYNTVISVYDSFGETVAIARTPILSPAACSPSSTCKVEENALPIFAALSQYPGLQQGSYSLSLQRPSYDEILQSSTSTSPMWTTSSTTSTQVTSSSSSTSASTSGSSSTTITSTTTRLLDNGPLTSMSTTAVGAASKAALGHRVLLGAMVVSRIS